MKHTEPKCSVCGATSRISDTWASPTLCQPCALTSPGRVKVRRETEPAFDLWWTLTGFRFTGPDRFADAMKSYDEGVRKECELETLRDASRRTAQGPLQFRTFDEWWEWATSRGDGATFRYIAHDAWNASRRALTSD
jgi:hypothetical protein